MAVLGFIPPTLAQSFDEIMKARGGAAKWLLDNQDWLKEVVQGHKTFLNESKIAEYQNAYDGYLDSIELRDEDRGDGTNYRIQAVMAQFLIDFVVDYMLGKALVWSFEDKDDNGKPDDAKLKLLDEYRNELTALLETEEGQRILRELLTHGSVAGYWTALGWVDEDGKIDFEDFPVQEMIPVFSSRGRLMMVIRVFDHAVQEPGTASPVIKQKIEVYDKRFSLFAMDEGSGTDFKLDLEEGGGVVPVFEHGAARIPVTVFLNGAPANYKDRKKKVGVSDLSGGVLDLVDAYANGISDKGNLADRLQDAFLVFTGVSMGTTKKEAEAEVMSMIKSRAIALTKEGSTAQFIAPDQGDGAVENYLDRVKDTMYEKAFIPKMNEISGATATEIKVKYSGVDIKAGKKEVYFTSAIKSLVAILTDFINAKRLVAARIKPEAVYDILAGITKPPGAVVLFNPEWAVFTMNRNAPQNNLETAQIVSTLAEIVPDTYLYELLWFIEDPKAALADMEAQRTERAAAAQAALFPPGFDSTDPIKPEGGGA